ncbi:gonadotropin-releasing hormone receptor-like [Tachypleus tridentatus]|uniref:gonadotropin-releasing hormone receptor-like n=1 Tax=Tachypleus tridentatus TaxID=6853 RepID=UPI003FD246D4
MSMSFIPINILLISSLMTFSSPQNFTFDPNIIMFDLVEIISELKDMNCSRNKSPSDNNNGTLFAQTSLNHAPKYVKNYIVRVCVLCVITVISLTGNMAVLFSIFKAQLQSRSTVHLLLTHLAIADLIVTFFCVLTDAIWTYSVQWLAGNILCKVVKFFQMFGLYLSTFILVIIGYDRFAAFRYPFRRNQAKGHVQNLIILVWFLSAIFSIPQAIIFNVRKGPFVEEFYQCVTYGSYTSEWQEKTYTMATLFIMFVIPLIALTGLYIGTFCIISSKYKTYGNTVSLLKTKYYDNIFSGKEDIFTETDAGFVIDKVRSSVIRKAKMKALQITFVIVLTFIVFWIPYYMMMVILIFIKPDEVLSNELKVGIFFFGSSTAMVNPLIYGLFHLRKRPLNPHQISKSAGSLQLSNMTISIKKRNQKRCGISGNASVK